GLSIRQPPGAGRSGRCRIVACRPGPEKEVLDAGHLVQGRAGRIGAVHPVGGGQLIMRAHEALPECVVAWPSTIHVITPAQVPDPFGSRRNTRTEALAVRPAPPVRVPPPDPPPERHGASRA